MSLSDKEIASHLPLTPAVFQILVALAEGVKHGYGVLLDVRERTGGSVKLGTGTLYTAIKRLLDQGLIEAASAPAGADPEESHGRRYYGLTELGTAVATAEAERLEAMLEVARERRLLGDRTVVKSAP